MFVNCCLSVVVCRLLFDVVCLLMLVVRCSCFCFPFFARICYLFVVCCVVLLCVVVVLFVVL